MLISNRPQTVQRAILEMRIDLFVDIAKQGTTPFRLIDNALPDDVRIVNVAAKWDRPDTLQIVVESASFDEVPAGEPLPILPSPIFRRLEDV